MALIGAALALAGCSTDGGAKSADAGVDVMDGIPCEPGHYSGCSCGDDRRGGRICRPDGHGWKAPCSCVVSEDGSAEAAGGGGSSGGAAGGMGFVDSGPQPPPDGGLGVERSPSCTDYFLGGSRCTCGELECIAPFAWPNWPACCPTADAGACGESDSCGSIVNNRTILRVPHGYSQTVYAEFPTGCIATDQPGQIEPSCSGYTLRGVERIRLAWHFSDSPFESEVPGCRKPTGECGYWFDQWGLGCIDPALLEPPDAGGVVCSATGM